VGERTQRDSGHDDTDKQEDPWVRAYNLGTSIGELAQQSGLSYTWMRRKLIDAGAEIRRRPKPRRCPVPVDQLAAEYYAGQSIKRLAEAHGLYYKRVRNLLLDHGVQLRPSTRTKSDH